jgi:hypothetical protein
MENGFNFNVTMEIQEMEMDVILIVKFNLVGIVREDPVFNLVIVLNRFQTGAQLH